jgi:hypothetical protein
MGKVTDIMQLIGWVSRRIGNRVESMISCNWPRRASEGGCSGNTSKMVSGTETSITLNDVEIGRRYRDCRIGEFGRSAPYTKGFTKLWGGRNGRDRSGYAEKLIWVVGDWKWWQPWRRRIWTRVEGYYGQRICRGGVHGIGSNQSR